MDEFYFTLCPNRGQGVSRLNACVFICLRVSLCSDWSVVKGVKELILAGGQLRQVLEASITIATMT